MDLIIISLVFLLVWASTLIYFIISKKKSTNSKIDVDNLSSLSDYLTKNQSDLNNLNLEISKLKDQYVSSFNMLVNNLSTSLSKSEQTTHNTITSIQLTQKNEFDNIQKKVDDLIYKNEMKINRLTDDVSRNLTLLRQENDKKLEAMRETVDEKLNRSLSTRLNESFSKIQESLEHVDSGLGEMKALANGVGDLKKMLGNVKTRGVWGEVMLNNLLEQVLSPSQFEEQVQIKQNSRERVDFVVKLPGKDDREVLLPIDSKFPLDDYYRLAEASDNANIEEMEKYHKAISRRIKEEAKKINEKYISVPDTTDFAIMFLPIEGLYAEVVRDIELIDSIQTQYKIIVSGPTNLIALLNSLQMGFKTLYIEKRSSEIWQILAEFKNEFEKFVGLLLKTQNKISDANDTIEQATKSSRKIAKKLTDVSQVVGINEPNDESSLDFNVQNFEDDEEAN